MANLFDKPAETNENLKHIFVQIREKEGQYCIELELDKKRSMSSLLELVREEYQLGASEIPIITKRPDILIRNDREVQRVQTGDQLEFIRIPNDQD